MKSHNRWNQQKLPIPCYYYIEMFCFGFPSSAHIARHFFWCISLANFTRKKPLNSITQNRWWHHSEAQLCFEIDSKWNFQETSTFSKKRSNSQRNTETNCNYLLHGVLWLHSIWFFIAGISKYDSKWVSISKWFQLLCRLQSESIMSKWSVTENEMEDWTWSLA